MKGFMGRLIPEEEAQTAIDEAPHRLTQDEAPGSGEFRY